MKKVRLRRFVHTFVASKWQGQSGVAVVDSEAQGQCHHNKKMSKFSQTVWTCPSLKQCLHRYDHIPFFINNMVICTYYLHEHHGKNNHCYVRPKAFPWVLGSPNLSLTDVSLVSRSRGRDGHQDLCSPSSVVAQPDHGLQPPWTSRQRPAQRSPRGNVAYHSSWTSEGKPSLCNPTPFFSHPQSKDPKTLERVEATNRRGVGSWVPVTGRAHSPGTPLIPHSHQFALHCVIPTRHKPLWWQSPEIWR